MAGSTKSTTKKRTPRKTTAKSKATANGASRAFTPEPGDFRRYWDSGHTHESLGLEAETLLAMYRSMMLQRRFEERAAQMYGRQKISGFLHLYIGQEAVSVGSVWATRPDDPIITAYRDHGLALARGMSSKAGMAELFGKIDGCSRGKGGSMHFFDVEKSFYGGHGIVGGQIPVGVGMAFALKYKETGGCALTYFGDGAINQGAFHEAANLAALYELPVLLVVENNEYAMGTAVHRATAEPDLYKQAYAYGMTGAIVDGMDVFEVYHAMKELADEARAGKPALVEIRTYRYRGHSMSDPQKYRTKEELEQKKDEDPILVFKAYLLENDIATNEQLDALDEEVKAEVMEAVEFAENSPFPPLETMYEDIYTQEDYPFLA
ncbi:MAG: pyruvate dehydrogenase (acetyl-transferring) E1 component subunit alpha [Rhodothermaceae bacterium]|nr:pyruvate dehydrogenase (acetyl-transferring) E1 component subunit alpha [Rhodothermaceae bacterium]